MRDQIARADLRPRGVLFENQTVKLLTLGELARRLKVSVSGLRKIVARDDRFPKYKVGQQLRFDWDTVARYFHKGDI